MYLAIKGNVKAVYKIRLSDIKSVTEYLKDIPYQTFSDRTIANKWVGISENHGCKKFADCIEKLKNLKIIPQDKVFTSKNKKQNAKLTKMQEAWFFSESNTVKIITDLKKQEEVRPTHRMQYLAIKGDFNNVYEIKKSIKKDIEKYLMGIGHKPFGVPSEAFKWLGMPEDSTPEKFDSILDKLIESYAKKKGNTSCKSTMPETIKEPDTKYNSAKKEKDVERKKIREAENEIELDRYATNYSEGTRTYLEHYMMVGGDRFAFGTFRGKVSKIDKGWGTCFESLYVEFEENDGYVVQGKEDHVWIVNDEKFLDMGIKVGDCVEFTALTNTYKRKNGSIDFGLKCPECIKKISDYTLPDNYELVLQGIERSLCEICLYSDHCYGFCVADPVWRENMTIHLLTFAKAPEEYFKRYMNDRLEKTKRQKEIDNLSLEDSKNILKNYYEDVSCIKSALDKIISDDFKMDDENVKFLEVILQNFSMDDRMRDAIINILEPYYKDKKSDLET